MKTTGYFWDAIEEHNVTYAQVLEALDHEVHREKQPDGRIRVWGWIQDRELYMRVILIGHGTTLLNAFFDSNFTRKRGRP